MEAQNGCHCAWAATKGITNGQLTRDQFTEYVKERLPQAQFGGGGTATSGPEVKEEKSSVEVYRLKNVEPNDALEALNVLVGISAAPWATNNP